jgi:hypothetical protein
MSKTAKYAWLTGTWHSSEKNPVGLQKPANALASRMHSENTTISSTAARTAKTRALSAKII